MYFIKQINIDDKLGYQSSKIINHTTKHIQSALKLLDTSLRHFVKEERGRDDAEQINVTDIKKLEEVIAPIKDCIMAFRLESDPYKIYVYQRKTHIVKTTGWWSGKDAAMVEFRLTDIFELEEYHKFIGSTKNSLNSLILEDLVPTGPSKIKIPKKMTISPMRDVITELKNSIKFRNRFSEPETIVINI